MAPLSRARKDMKIAIDFDGTIVEHEYPHVGRPVPLAIEYIKQFKEAGHKLILWTMRSGETLDDAVEYCRANGVEFDAVNQGLGDRNWTSSNKAHANVYIDDAAFGCPLVPGQDSKRGMVDWRIVGPSVLKMGEQ